MNTPRVGLRAVPTLLLALGVGLASAGCASGSDHSDATNAAVEVAPGADGAADAADAEAARGSVDDLSATLSHASQPGEDTAVIERQLISTGTVELRSDDVAATVRAVQTIVDRYASQVGDQSTTTDDDGDASHARMVIRVPADDFDAAFSDIEEAAELARSDASSEDVTTQVIDTKVRIRAQRRSLQRIEVLLDRATSIGDIVRIEAELTRRQSKLDSLEQQQAYLADQTSLSTITVTVAEDTDRADAPDEEETGFLSGLSAGWGAFVAALTALATVTGWLLPFLAVLLLPALVGWRLLRGRRRRTTMAVPTGDSA